MKLNLKRPLAILDLETTGTDVSSDRIVEISVVKLSPNDQQEIFSKRVNPTISISPEASNIHGIYDKDVKDAPKFKAIAKDLLRFLEGADIGGFNIVRFDLPLLVEEFLRAEYDFKISQRKIVDVQKLFHLMEKRSLTAAYKFYCDKELENAHSAEADSLATLEVLKAQIAKYQGMPVIDALGKELTTVENDIEKLHILSTNDTVDLAGRFTYNSDGIVVFNFGKYKGKPVSQILQKDPSYYDWMMRGSFTLDTKRKLTQLKLELNLM